MRTRTLFYCWLGALIAWGGIHLGRPHLGAGNGLTVRYYPNPERTGTPTFEGPDGVPSAAQFARHWSAAVPETFGVVWEGYLSVADSGSYRFETTSDDGSWLYIDEKLIVDNGGAHSPVTQGRSTYLSGGPHHVRLEYGQLGGGYALEWTWGLEGAPPRPVPLWALSTRTVSRQRASVARALDAVSTALAFACVAGAAWLLATQSVPAARRMAGPLARGIVARYRSRTAFGVSVAAYAALLCVPWGPWGLLDTFLGTTRQLGSATVASLTDVRPFLANLQRPHAGEEQAIPGRVLTMVELLELHGFNRYALSPAITENPWVHQQMIATAWPRTLEPDASERFFLSTEAIPASCHLVEQRDEVSLVHCP